MPIKQVIKNKELYGFKWGISGKIYSINKFGKKGAYNKAVKQAQAIFASGWKEK